MCRLSAASGPVVDHQVLARVAERRGRTVQPHRADRQRVAEVEPHRGLGDRDPELDARDAASARVCAADQCSRSP